MREDSTQKLVLAVSEEALFQRDTQSGKSLPGPAFHFMQGMAEAGSHVIVFSKRGLAEAQDLYDTMSAYSLLVTRAFFTGGTPEIPYLRAIHADLFLTEDAEMAQRAADAGIATGQVWIDGDFQGRMHKEVRIAFDGDAVLFCGDSEKIFKEQGIAAFEEHEATHAEEVLKEGPLAPFLKKLTRLCREEILKNVRTALVTSRCAPAQERVLRTLQKWDVAVDELFFLGGMPKSEILEAFGATIFFDDQKIHVETAAKVVASALVPERKKYEVRQYNRRNFSGKTKSIHCLCGTAWKGRDGTRQEYGQM